MIDIVVDTREKTPWTFEAQSFVTTTRAKLDAGDYSLAGFEHRVAVERKSLDDWVNTVLRDRARFYRELERLRAYELRWVVIEATVEDIYRNRSRSSVSPASVLGFVGEVTASQRVPVILGGSRPAAQEYAAWLLRGAKSALSGR